MLKAVVFIEQRNGVLKRASLEALSKAAELAGDVYAVAIGSSLHEAVTGLGKYGATKVFLFEHPSLQHYAPTAYAKILARVVKEESASIVLLAATSMGKDLAPRLSIRLAAGLVSDAIAIQVEGDRLLAKRYAYSGKAIATVQLDTPIQILTLRPNVFPIATYPDRTAEVVTSTYNPDETDLRAIVKEIVASAGKLDVTEADIVVSGGRGLRDPKGDGKENWQNLEALASVLGAAVGASRAVVDAGWRPHSEQVGQTGKVVSPKLYIACGISGAIQHLAGMASSKVIVAINKDKDAPIFQVADYGIVGTVEETLPKLTEEFKKLLSQH
ncbi:MAG: electron transfer flavoprotein subunit alpha/FixB family protein [Chloroherpetonaceae bacterium]|nr:electron transfer flavoprotein subunit alpha/FixB family protein [Chloroherpetonaceae bacterium]MCS7212016.1 electron transfer flavoprotein subunit alpha/FixB family protein [Chloroherpetonaceae bacterium]MDW8020720.1 electron transfer flavoprotein subunit alpha/FixB family protein [Chloroherpetonaceae bacterium]MDW8465707.1 electron transfer flavoprotein subunit alpha/FixB family protein [Chloroherpetonaceae bacterium]